MTITRRKLLIAAPAVILSAKAIAAGDLLGLMGASGRIARTALAPAGYDIFVTMSDSNGFFGANYDAGLDVGAATIFQLGVNSPNTDVVILANDPLDQPDTGGAAAPGYIGPYVHFLKDSYIANGKLLSPRNCLIVANDKGGSYAGVDNFGNWGALTGSAGSPTTSGSSLLHNLSARLTTALAETGTNTVKAAIGIEGSNAYVSYGNTFQLGVVSPYRWQLKRKIQFLRNLLGAQVPIILCRETTNNIDFAHSTYSTNGVIVDGTIQSIANHFPYCGVADSQSPSQLGTAAGNHFTAADQRLLAARYYTAYLSALTNTGPTLQWDALDYMQSANGFSSGFTITNSNLDLSGDANSNWKTAVAVPPCRSGKKYAEIKIQAMAGDNMYLGFCNADFSLNNLLGSAAADSGPAKMSAGQRGAVADNSVQGYTKVWAGTASWALNDIIMLDVDMTAGKAWIGKNGTWYNSGDPAAGTNPWISGIVDPIYIAASIFTGTGNTFRLVPSSFTYTPPSGSTAWSP